MKNYNIIFLGFALWLLPSNIVSAQNHFRMRGDASAITGVTYSYHVDFKDTWDYNIYEAPPMPLDAYHWNVSGGTLTQLSAFDVQVVWNDAGVHHIELTVESFDNFFYEQMDVTVSDPTSAEGGNPNRVEIYGTSAVGVGQYTTYRAVFYGFQDQVINPPANFTSSWSSFSSVTPYDFFEVISPTMCRVKWKTEFNYGGYSYRLRYDANIIDGYNNYTVSNTTPDIENIYTSPLPLEATQVTENSFVANWQENGASSYIINMWPVSVSSPIPDIVGQRITTTSQLLAGLRPGTDYIYQVQALYEQNSRFSRYSTIIKVRTLMERPLALSAVGANNNGMFGARWSLVNGADSYRLEVSTDQSFLSNVTSFENITSDGFSVQDLPPGVTYYYRVIAKSGQNESLPSNVITITTRTIAPTALRPTYVDVGTFTANWTPVQGVGYYNLEVSKYVDFSSFEDGYHAMHVNGTSATITGLKPGTTYYYMVSAVNLSGFESEFSYTIMVNGLSVSYIKEELVTAPGKTTEELVNSASVNEKNTKIDFYDGLGRLSQTVLVKNSPSKQDFVQPIVYDQVGRQVIKMLPYADGTSAWFKNNALTGQTLSEVYDLSDYQNSNHYNFYQTGGALTTDLHPYSVTVLDALDRPIKQGMVGTPWQPIDDTSINDHSVKINYELNSDGEVYQFDYDEEKEMPVISNDPEKKYYKVNTLIANKTLDEMNNISIEYKDKAGRLICKKVQVSGNTQAPTFASTYYLYDDFENLIVVLSPEAVERIVSPQN